MDTNEQLRDLGNKLDEFRTDVVDRLARIETSNGSTHRWVEAHEGRLSAVEAAASRLKGFGTAFSVFWTLLLGLAAYIFKVHAHGGR